MPTLNWKIGSTITTLDPKHEGATQGHDGSIKQTNSTFIIWIDNKLNNLLLLDNIVLKIQNQALKRSKPQLEGMVATMQKLINEQIQKNMEITYVNEQIN
jgi:hypothetical protein